MSLKRMCLIISVLIEAIKQIAATCSRNSHGAISGLLKRRVAANFLHPVPCSFGNLLLPVKTGTSSVASNALR